MDEAIDQALSILKRKPIDGYEIYLEEASNFDAETEGKKVDTLQTSQSMGMAFRILNKKRVGFSYTTSPLPSLSGLEKTIEDAIASAEVTSPDPCFDFSPVLSQPLPQLPIFDETLEKVSEKKKIEKAKLLEEAARSVDPERIKKVRKASYHETTSRITLVNSNGLHFSFNDSLTSVSVMAVAEESGEYEVGWDFDFSHFIDDLNVIKIGKAAGRKALERLGGRRVPSGIYPVLLDHHVASEFLSLLAHSFLAEQVQKGKSALRDRKGEPFFSPVISVIDDGLLIKGVSTYPIDGEGMLNQRTSLVIQGEIKGYLYDRFWANRENLSSKGLHTESTGNSRRHGIRFPPGLGTSNFFIEPGTTSSSSLIKDLQRGLLVEEVMGLHTVDLISGQFSLGCSGHWIEQGEKVYPVKSIAIAGSIFQLFKKVVEIGEDIRFFGKVGSPSLLIESLEISGN